MFFFSDREALVTILTKPKNSIIAQYKYLLELDDCKLTFTDDSLNAIADLAIQKRTGELQIPSITPFLETPSCLLDSIAPA